MDEIKWGDPPPPKAGTGVNGARQRFVAALKARPGEWAQYRPEQAHTSGAAPGMRAAFPGLEVAQRSRPDGKFDVYARWVGNGSEPS